jgi:L-iditol 2-dehydrogenase
MLALYKTQKGEGFLELREASIPKIEPNEALIEVKAAGVCGTDIHIKHDRFPYWPPVILGHEYSGVIVKTGAQVHHFKVGERVVGEPHTKACGVCYLCRTGNIQICPQKRSPGWGIDGAFARYLKVPEHLLHRIPDELSFEEAAVVEPTANAVHDVLERAKVEPEDFVIVFGPGPIGLLAAQAARAGGARKVAMIGTPADENLRLNVARELGLDYVINVGKEDAVKKIMDLTDNRGADLVVEASGSEKAIQSTVTMVRKKGRICAIGMTSQEQVNFPWNQAVFKVAEVHFCLSTSYTSWDRTISLLARRAIRVDKIITHKMSLTEWEKAFDVAENQKGLKALLIP